MQRITEAKEIRELKMRKKPVILHFYTEYLSIYSSWCGPCKMTHKILEREMAKSPGSIVLANINCDECEDLVLDYRVEVVPTLILLDKEMNPTLCIVFFYSAAKGYKTEKIGTLFEKARSPDFLK